MAIKEYSAFPKALALQEPHQQIVYCNIQDPHWESYSFSEMQSEYSAASANWTTKAKN